ncbi:hypothetical protein Tco_0047630, partial [Tanacetum coccineum]
MANTYRKSLPRLRGTLLTSSISRITKSTRNVDLPVGIKRLHDDLGVNTAKITTARRVSTVTRIKTREMIKMEIVYQDYLWDKKIRNSPSKVKISISLKVKNKKKKESSDEECSTFGSEDEEYAMAVRDFKKFFKRRGRFMRQPRNDKNTFQRSRDDKNGKAVKDDDKVKNETCLVSHASSKVCSESSYFSDENSLIDDLALDNEYDNNLRGNIIGKGQICDNNCRVTFSEHDSEITKDGKVIGR